MEINLKHQENHPIFQDISNFQTVLNYLMDSRNITAAKLSKETNIPPPTISKLLSGVTEDPKISTIATIANFFSVTIDQLMGISPLDKNNVNIHESISLPIISWNQSISYKNFLLSLDEENWKEWVLTEKPLSKLSFGLKTKHHLEPRFPTGSVLIIEPDIDVCEGDLVIVHYNESSESAIREVIFDGSKKKFIHLNGNSSSNEDDEIVILGVVVKTVFSYKERRN